MVEQTNCYKGRVRRTEDFTVKKEKGVIARKETSSYSANMTRTNIGKYLSETRVAVKGVACSQFSLGNESRIRRKAIELVCRDIKIHFTRYYSIRRCLK